MSIRSLLLVLCFHIKRLEHSLIRRMSKKIDQYLNFPFSPDMTPYLSSSIIRKRFGSRIFAFERDESEVSSELSQEFEVFAVVSHMGQMDSGHYVTYLRLKDQWHKCDDAWITKVNEGVVKGLTGLHDVLCAEGIILQSRSQIELLSTFKMLLRNDGGERLSKGVFPYKGS